MGLGSRGLLFHLPVQPAQLPTIFCGLLGYHKHEQTPPGARAGAQPLSLRRRLGPLSSCPANNQLTRSRSPAARDKRRARKAPTSSHASTRACESNWREPAHGSFQTKMKDEPPYCMRLFVTHPRNTSKTSYANHTYHIISYDTIPDHHHHP